MSEAPRSITLSLVSHTNAGKTTLARTLLGRDVGEVRDEAHVTTSAERYVLLESAAGDVLYLWDTPVTSLEPLRGMPLKNLALVDVPATNFEAIAGLPLQHLLCA